MQHTLIKTLFLAEETSTMFYFLALLYEFDTMYPDPQEGSECATRIKDESCKSKYDSFQLLFPTFHLADNFEFERNIMFAKLKNDLILLC